MALSFVEWLVALRCPSLSPTIGEQADGTDAEEDER